MLIRRLNDCARITAGDHTLLRELLHPDREYRFSGRYSLAHAVLPVGQRSTRHTLATDEVYYILSGEAEMHVDDEAACLAVGDTVEIPPGSTQWIANIGDCPLEFLCIVDPAWRKEDEAMG